MMRKVTILTIFLQAITLNVVDTAKQQVQLSDSYLPVAMQVIAHLTDQMAYEARDEPEKTTSKPISRPTSQTTSRPTSKPTSRPTSRPTDRPDAVYVNSYPMTNWPTSRPSSWLTNRPDAVYVNSYPMTNWPGWRVGWFRQQTTPYHKPGLYAPIVPPKPNDRTYLLPPNPNQLHTVIQPQKSLPETTLLSIQEEKEEVKPLIEPLIESHLLPPHFEASVDKISRSDLPLDDWEQNLQYLSPNVRDMIRLANDLDDERLIDDNFEDLRAGPQGPKGGKLSTSNLRLQLLYDLLSREAKRQRLSDYYGFSPDVLRTLSESSSGGARAQLRLALSKMVDRKDCQHEYANNRAKEMVDELGKDESKMSSEIRYLQPLNYNML